MEDAYLAFTAIQLVWIAVSVVWVLRRNDELPLITSIFLFYIFSFRFLAILQGWTNPVDISNFGFENPSLLMLAESHGLGAIGHTVFLLVYMLVQKHRVTVIEPISPPHSVRSMRTLVFTLIGICLPVALFARASVGAQISAGASTAFEISNYVSLFPLALVGIVVLIGGLIRARAFDSFFSAVAVILSIVTIAYITFQPSLRFQFLGWVVAVTVILSSGKSVAHKAWRISCGVAIAVVAFAVQGALRNAADPDAQLERNAWERFAFAHDANMLDGFVLMRQVYPDLLNYSYGGEHFEILQRAIPRAWWPDKPVGGYMNKLGIIDVHTGFTLGISPSLFGSFYQEGALPGLILLSGVYGYAFGRFVRFSTRLVPFTGLVIRGCLSAALIPLLRGGDLPGIYAWFGMSFWPTALVLWIHRRDLWRRDPAPVQPEQQHVDAPEVASA